MLPYQHIAQRVGGAADVRLRLFTKLEDSDFLFYMTLFFI
jgi:hypothetical protein